MPFPRCVSGTPVCAKTLFKDTRYGARKHWVFVLHRNDVTFPDKNIGKIYVDMATLSTNRCYNILSQSQMYTDEEMIEGLELRS